MTHGFGARAPAGGEGSGRAFSAKPTVLAALTLLLFVAALGLGGCATIGRDFPAARVGDIRLQQTTQEEIHAMFGEPWRVGVEDGQRTWTFARYRYKLFGQPNTRDLVVRFNDQGIVVSYTFNTTDLEEGLPRR